MFSEENIERTKEKLVEYVEDNRYSFARRYNGGRSGYWEITAKDLSVKLIEDAIELLGTATTVDIIVDTLNDIHCVSGGASYLVVKPTEFAVNDDEDEDYYDDYDEDDYGYDDDYDGFYEEDEDDEYKVFISGNSPLSLYEWTTSDDVKSDKQTMGYIAKANVESENEDEPEIVRSSTTYSFSMPSGKEVSDKDMVNHPPHYNQGKFETIDIIEDIVRGYDDPVEAYLVGTTIKYLARAPFKGAKKQDLEKAVFYLKRAIDKQQ
jgi:hypothetical protein